MYQSKAAMYTFDFEQLPDSALIRLNHLLAINLIPFSTSTVWRQIREGRFPAPIKISNQVTAWRVGEIRVWLRDPKNYRQRTAIQGGRERER